MSEEARIALDEVADWWAREMVGNEVCIVNWRPPAEFVDRIVANMVCMPDLGWPDEDSARGYLEEELFPALPPERTDR